MESSVDIAAATAPARIAPVSHGETCAKSSSGKIRSGMSRSGHRHRAAEADERSRDIERHQVDRRRCPERLQRLRVDRRVVADEHVGLQDDAERQRDGHPDPHAGSKEPVGSGQLEQVGALRGDFPPELERPAEQLVREHDRADPDGGVHPDPLQHVGPVDRPQPARDQVERSHYQQQQRPDLERDAPAGGDGDDVAEPLRLNLDVQDGEDDRYERDRDPYQFRLVEVREQVGRGDVAEHLAERPDTRAEDIGDGAGEHRPRAGRPEADAMRIEKAGRTEEGEGRMEGRDDGQVEDDETGLPAVQHEVLHVDRQAPVREHAEEEGHAQVGGDQGGRDLPGFHQVPL